MDYNKRSGSNHNDRRDYGSRESRPYRSRSENGEGRSFNRNNDSRSSFGERRPRRTYGDRPAYSTDRPVYSTDRAERVTFDDNGGRRPSFHSNGERRSYGQNGERRPYRQEGERRSFHSDGERRPYGQGGERKPYRQDGERRSFHSDGDRKPYGQGGERRPYSSEGGYNRHSSGDRKPGFRKRTDGKASFGQNRPRFTKPMFRNEDESGISKMIDRRKTVENEMLSDNDNVSFPIKEEVRLNRYIANSGICSRREADNFILAGCVTVNGELVTELGTKVNINKDDVRFNGERLHGEAKVYIVMNKPKGFVTTTSDPHAEKTVMELLKKCPSRVFPVGRLDKNTTGVLMFTNDGEIAERLTHPSYDKKKIYQVSLGRDLSQEDYEKILSGVELSDGDVAADALEYIEENDKRKLGIEIHSGKNRIVRRIFESLGYDVKALDRVYFAGLTKKGIKRGEWRYLTEGEVNILKMGAYI